MNIKGLLIDLDGTLYADDGPIEGAGEALDQLKSSGIAVRYVTNTTREPRSAVYEKLHAFGFDIEEAEILTPARIASRLIGDRSCFPLVDEALYKDLDGVRLTGESPELVVVGDLGEEFTYGRLNEAFRKLVDGAELIALQKTVIGAPEAVALEAVAPEANFHSMPGRLSPP